MGIDIGSTSVKALAVGPDGTVLARSRVGHALLSPAPDQLEHDARRAWRTGPRRAFAKVSAGLDVAGVCVAGMVPSLTAVDSAGIPRLPGLLYGDSRGYGPQGAPAASAMPDAEGFVRWAKRQYPDAFGYWPAQAVASYALAGVAVIDSFTSVTLGPLLQGGSWDPLVLEKAGIEASQMPVIAPVGEAAGKIPGTDTVLAGGTIDALCDQIVSGAEEVGDVLVICGATLIVWAVVGSWLEVPGLWTIPHTAAGRILVGGPSNAGALFVDWTRSMLRGGDRRHSYGTGEPGSPLATTDPENVPVWLPYLRGERVPFHDPTLRASLHDLDITHDAPALQRAAYETSGFVVRRVLDSAGIRGRRIVASGGGTRVAQWMQAMADATGLPVDTVAVSEGAALGAAYLARLAAGLESEFSGSGRWARRGKRYEPDPLWAEASERRYRRFSDLGPGS